MSAPVFVQSKITGGHYAFQTKRASKPFENNMRECKSIALYDNDTVADIGAYVGEYSRYAALNGAGRVLSYEPTPRTFGVLKMNRLPEMELFNVAIVGDDRKTARLFLSKGVGVTNSIAKHLRKAGSIEVPAMRYEDAIREATIVKIDVEGAEYLYNIVQSQLRAIILEFHPIAKKPWRQWAEKIMEDIEAADFTPIMRPTFKSGWSLTGSWIRKSK